MTRPKDDFIPAHELTHRDLSPDQRECATQMGWARWDTKEVDPVPEHLHMQWSVASGKPALESCHQLSLLWLACRSELENTYREMAEFLDWHEESWDTWMDQ